jgi:hypothetical protein
MAQRTSAASSRVERAGPGERHAMSDTPPPSTGRRTGRRTDKREGGFLRPPHPRVREEPSQAVAVRQVKFQTHGVSGDKPAIGRPRLFPAVLHSRTWYAGSPAR